jgi:sulfoxide reductase heme-binding subunit YedZ
MKILGQSPSTLVLWVILFLPTLGMIGPLVGDDPKAFHGLLHPTGEFAARFMIVGMMASGLMLLFKGRAWPRWLMHHRRDIEVAAFAYAALHVLVYMIDRGTLERIVDQLPQTRIWTGWLAFLVFVPLAVTSNDAAQRWLHAGWKTMQRAAYPAAVLVLLHWAAMKDGGSWSPALIHFGPLLGLWGYRIWYWYLRDRPAAA